MGHLSQCLDCEARKQSQLMWCHPAQLSRRYHTPGSKAGAEGLGGKFLCTVRSWGVSTAWLWLQTEALILASWFSWLLSQETGTCAPQQCLWVGCSWREKWDISKPRREAGTCLK